jgi:hypothetical protein
VTLARTSRGSAELSDVLVVGPTVAANCANPLSKALARDSLSDVGCAENSCLESVLVLLQIPCEPNPDCIDCYRLLQQLRGAMCFVWQGGGDAADSNAVVSPHYVLIALATRILNAHVSV